MEQNNVSISPMQLDDLEQISGKLETDFDDFWKFNILKSELENPNSVFFVAKFKNQIVGFTGIEIVLDEADIVNIVVKKNYRKNGIASLLMENLIDFCKKKGIKKINLEVNSSNDIAIKLYKHFGFLQVGCRKNYYSNGDGLLFSLKIDQ